CSSVKRERFISISFLGDGLYPKMEEKTGLTSVEILNDLTTVLHDCIDL
ncbi:hypothetical protein EDD55_1011, partial [Varunaivibrio sulfuroxidans]